MSMKGSTVEDAVVDIADGNMETAILSSLFKDMEYVAMSAGRITEESFSRKSARDLFKIVNKFKTKYPGTSITPELLLKTPHLASGDIRSLLEEVVAFPPVPTQYMLDQTSSFVRRHAMRDAFITSYDMIEDPDRYPEIEAKFKKAMSMSSFEDLGLDYFEEQSVRKRMERRKTSAIGNVRTMFTGIDDALFETNRSVAGGTLNVFAGVSNIGKSIWLGQLAKNIADQGKVVVIYSLEMNEDSYASRLDANYAKVKTDSILAHEQHVTESVINAGVASGGKIIIKQVPTGTASSSDLMTYLNSLKLRGIVPDAVCIDYLNLMRPAQKVSSSISIYERVKYIAEELRAVAIYFDIPFFSATQLNRTGYGSTPSAQQISESMGLMHTVDLLIGIYQNNDDKAAGVMRSIIIKNRYGPRDLAIDFDINYDYLSITNKVGETSQRANSEDLKHAKQLMGEIPMDDKDAPASDDMVSSGLGG